MDISPSEKIEILKTRYTEHAAHLRHFNEYELRVTGGFLTIQLVLGGWLGQDNSSPLSAIILSIIDIGFLYVCLKTLKALRRRREEATKTIQSINRALGLYELGFYVADKQIDPDPLDEKQRRFWGFIIAAILGCGGVVVIALSKIDWLNLLRILIC